MIKPMTIRQFARLLPKICGKDTSFDPDGWTKENPLWGHCAIVALLAKSLFSGEIVYGSLKGTQFVQMTFHFWNSLPDGKRPDGRQKDCTRAQFGKDYPKFPEVKTAIPKMFKNESTQRRFRLLQERFAAECKHGA